MTSVRPDCIPLGLTSAAGARDAGGTLQFRGAGIVALDAAAGSTRRFRGGEIAAAVAVVAWTVGSTGTAAARLLAASDPPVSSGAVRFRCCRSSRARALRASSRSGRVRQGDLVLLSSQVELTRGRQQVAEVGMTRGIAGCLREKRECFGCLARGGQRQTQVDSNALVIRRELGRRLERRARRQPSGPGDSSYSPRRSRSSSLWARA